VIRRVRIASEQSEEAETVFPTELAHQQDQTALVEAST
jgi:hypothetical protein